MAIIRTPKTKEYFSVSNKLAQDARLSFEARGVLLYLLSKPSDWIVQFSDVEKEGNIGREKRQKIFAELETAGYFERIEKREKGRFDYDYRVHEMPVNTEPQPRTAKPLTVKPATAQPLTVKPLHTKDREEQITELQKERQAPHTNNSAFTKNETEYIHAEKEKKEKAVFGVFAADAVPPPVAVIQENYPTFYPSNKEQINLLASVTEIDVWREVVSLWFGSGWKKTNVAGMVDRYQQELAKRKPVSTYVTLEMLEQMEREEIANLRRRNG